MDRKRRRCGYERGRASMSPLMVGIWDTEARLSIAEANLFIVRKRLLHA